MKQQALQRIQQCALGTRQRQWTAPAESTDGRTGPGAPPLLTAGRVLALLCMLGAGGAHAEEITVRMLDVSADGPLAFDPGFVKATLGDTLVFSPSSKGHTTESLLIPDGAKPWKSGYDSETRITFEKEGVYLYGCEAHLRMGMVGVVQVGQPVNLDAAKAFAKAESAHFVMNRDRLMRELARVR
ncbi:MAG: pseudoazurin [Candidatus Accumulibacter sp.]|nr:pseudoazurin [Accumulibacter sp.]